MIVAKLGAAAAAVFLLSATAPAFGQDPKADQQRVDHSGGSDTQQAADTIAGAIRETIRPLEKVPRCEGGDEDRQEELCAQLRAADAAEASALYALIALFVSAIGTSLLIWTLAETRATSRRELRAYVSIKVRAVRATVPNGGGLNVSFETVSHNGGMTPAYRCNHFGWAVVSRIEEAAKELARVRPITKGALDDGVVIHSGEDHQVENDAQFFLTPQMISDVAANRSSIFVFGVVSYVDTFGIRRRTDYCYYTGGDAFARAVGLGDGEQVPLIWKVTRFHNSAT